MLEQEIVIRTGDHVNNCVAESKDIMANEGHGGMYRPG
jgi:hypothetical protein